MSRSRGSGLRALRQSRVLSWEGAQPRALIRYRDLRRSGGAKPRLQQTSTLRTRYSYEFVPSPRTASRASTPFATKAEKSSRFDACAAPERRIARHGVGLSHTSGAAPTGLHTGEPAISTLRLIRSNQRRRHAPRPGTCKIPPVLPPARPQTDQHPTPSATTIATPPPFAAPPEKPSRFDPATTLEPPPRTH